MESVVDERGRLLIPQELREEIGLDEGTLVELHRKGKEILVTPSKSKRRSWRGLRGIKPKRTGEPQWPTPEEIKSIWG